MLYFPMLFEIFFVDLHSPVEYVHGMGMGRRNRVPLEEGGSRITLIIHSTSFPSHSFSPISPFPATI